MLWYIYILQFAAGQEAHTYLVHYLLDIGAGQNYIGNIRGRVTLIIFIIQL